MQTYLKEKRSLRRAVGGSQRPGMGAHSSLESALLKIASVRFEAFRSRFGRDPFPDEPLFFDPSLDQPVASASDEMRTQLLAAASATRSDRAKLLRYFGLE
jgi:hypothetical protein